MENQQKNTFSLKDFLLRSIILIMFYFSFQPMVLAQRTYTVNSTDDYEDVDLSDKICADKNGNCTLRAAIQNANASKLPDIIRFDLKDSVSKRIILKNHLPAFIYPIEIYGTENRDKINPDNGIIVDGNEIEPLFRDSKTPEKRVGFYLSEKSSGSTINGLIFQSFELSALQIDSENNIIQNNIFGSVHDYYHEGNGTGILLFGRKNLIGGYFEREINYFLGNLTGLAVLGDDNEVIGNEVGFYSRDNCTAKNGSGIKVNPRVKNTLIYKNIISGNTFGISLEGSGNRVYENLIGTDRTGKKIVGNFTGILVTAASSNSFIGKAGLGNLISGNEVGVFVDRMRGSVATAEQIRDLVLNIEIQSNKIGTDISGRYSLGNQYGVVVRNTGGVIIGGANPGDANLISGNQQAGILLQNSFEVMILGNTIGLNGLEKDDLLTNNGIILDDVKKNGAFDNILIKSNQIHSGSQYGIFVGEGWKNVGILANTITSSNFLNSSTQPLGMNIGFKKFNPSICLGEDITQKNIILFHKCRLLISDEFFSSTISHPYKDFQNNGYDSNVDQSFLKAAQKSPHQFPSYEKMFWEDFISLYQIRGSFIEGELESYQNYLARLPD
jgi:CSLREA domain-containing protein